MVRIRIPICALAAAAAAAVVARGAIYADFDTDQGTFSVELDALRAPRATANFMGLVDGTRTWRDPVTGAVRGGGDGNGFYTGMRFYSTAGSLALLGGMRSYTGGDGGEYWEGPGYTILDEVANGVELARGVLAMAEFDGPHSGGGEFAVMLAAASNTLGSGWTAFGAVTGAGMAVVEAIVSEVTNGSGQVTAQIAVRAGGMTPAEATALAAVQDELPSVEKMPMGFGRESNRTALVSFESSPQSQACLSTTSNLLAESWSVLPGTWNTGTNATWMEIPLASIPGLAVQQGFLIGSEAVYPKMTAEPFAGKQRVGAAHTGMDMQYWLDFDGGTGIWARVEGGAPVESGAISWIGQELATANSLHLVLFINWTAYHYWLGFDEAGAAEGRFYCELWYLNAELTGTDSGTYELAAGWAGMAFPRARPPVGRSIVRGQPKPMLPMETWAARRRLKTRHPIPAGGGMEPGRE